jgi:hypothetical protein
VSKRRRSKGQARSVRKPGAPIAAYPISFARNVAALSPYCGALNRQMTGHVAEYSAYEQQRQAAKALRKLTPYRWEGVVLLVDTPRGTATVATVEDFPALMRTMEWTQRESERIYGPR